MSGRASLYARGYEYAYEATNYLFTQEGKNFSVVTRERGKSVQVKIPRSAVAVHSLLAAIKAGLHLYIRKAILFDRCHTP